MTEVFDLIQKEAESNRRAELRKQQNLAAQFINSVNAGEHDGLCRNLYYFIVLGRNLTPLSVSPESAVSDLLHYHGITDNGGKESIKAAMLRYYDPIYQKDVLEKEQEAKRKKEAKNAEQQRSREEHEKRMRDAERRRNFWRSEG